MTRVVLGSASTGRLGVLRSAGIDPLVAVSGVDEDAVIAGWAPTPARREWSARWRQAKADAVRRVLDRRRGRRLRGDRLRLHALRRRPGCAASPERPENARRQWDSMAGAIRAALHRALRHADAGRRRGGYGDRRGGHHGAVRCAHRGRTAAYIASGEPLGVAGGFTLDGLGGWFIDGDRRGSLQRDRPGPGRHPAAVGGGGLCARRAVGRQSDWPHR